MYPTYVLICTNVQLISLRFSRSERSDSKSGLENCSMQGLLYMDSAASLVAEERNREGRQGVEVNRGLGHRR